MNSLESLARQATSSFLLDGLGVDIVLISEFKDKISIPGVLGKVFNDSELQEFGSLNSKTGVFAAKEAFFKALGRKVDWLEVWLERLPSGQPILHSVHIAPGKKAHVSISHDGNFAMAVVAIAKKEEEQDVGK